MEAPFSCRSKIGPVSAVCIVLVAAMVPASMLLSGWPSLLLAVVADLVLAIIILAIFLTRYDFGTESLIVKMPLHFKEPPVVYSSVKTVTVPGEWMYSHGFSKDTIGIRYGEKGYVSISPVDRSGTVEFLRKVCPQARFEIEK